MKPDAQSSLSTWLVYLEQIHAKSIDLGLTRVRAVAERLGVRKPAPYVITVAGTNGKGTTCRVLEMILIEAGFRVGVYSSPHMIDYTERIRIQNAQRSDDEHVATFVEIEAARKEISLSYFEFGTLSALMLLKQQAVDVAILEVGLGGRLDATNCVDADLAIVTTIGLDHTDWLGDTRESIGREKAGIARRDCPLVVGEPDMPHSIQEVANEVGAKLLTCEPNQHSTWSYQLHGDFWSFSSSEKNYAHLPIPAIPLANAATAVAALSYSALTVGESAIINGLTKATLPGRFQIIQNDPMVILDVAHNPHAAAYLAQRLSPYIAQGRKIIAVVGMLVDKDIAGTIAVLRDTIDAWYYAPLAGPRGASSEQMQQYIPTGIACGDILTAFEQAKQQAGHGDVIVVFGSFLTVSEILSTL